MYDLVLNRPLEGFVQDSPREELATGPVVECLTATAWQDYHQKTQLFVDFFPIEQHEYAALRKELPTAHRAR